MEYYWAMLHFPYLSHKASILAEAPESAILVPAGPDEGHELLARLIEILAPGPGDLLAFLECYFDESGTHDGSPVLCVAGYLFEKEKCQALDLEWKAVLDQYHLPYFRMSICAHNQHPNPIEPFGHLSAQECIDVEKAMIGLINKYALLGVAMAVNEDDYNHWFGPNSPSGDAYTFSCWQILASIQNWISQNNFDGKISYFFEAGHGSQSKANALMDRIFKNPQLRERYRYANHSFVSKEYVRPVQTADILAWHQGLQIKRWLQNNPKMRLDFQALVEKPRHELFIGNRHTLGGIIAYHRMVQGLPVINGITGHYGQSWLWSSFDGKQSLLI